MGWNVKFVGPTKAWDTERINHAPSSLCPGLRKGRGQPPPHTQTCLHMNVHTHTLLTQARVNTLETPPLCLYCCFYTFSFSGTPPSLPGAYSHPYCHFVPRILKSKEETLPITPGIRAPTSDRVRPFAPDRRSQGGDSKARASFPIHLPGWF